MSASSKDLPIPSLSEPTVPRPDLDPAQTETKDLKSARSQRLSSGLLTQVSRELRDPLRALLNNLQQLDLSDLNRDQRRTVDAAKLHALAMEHLTNDLLDLKNLNRGLSLLQTLPFSLRDCISATVASQLPRAQELGVSLSEDCEKDIPNDLIGDPGRLRQVLRTLLGNALISSRGGEVRVRVRLKTHDLETEQLQLHFTIEARDQDQAPHTLSAVETRRRARRERAKTEAVWRGGGATALGLSVSRQLIAQMQGETWVEAIETGGSGLHFTMRFQAQPPSRAPLERPTGFDLTGLRLLVIDGAPENTPELLDRLRRLGASPKRVRTLTQVRETLMAATAEDRPYSYLLVCASLDSRRSMAMIEAIGALPATLQLPLLLLTPTPERGDSLRARRLGVSAYLTLPLRARDLRDALGMLSDPLRAETLRRETLVTRHLMREARGLSPILIIASQPEERQWLAEELGDLGLRIEIADLDGALEIANQERPSPAFVIALLDESAQGPRLRELLSTYAKTGPRPALLGVVDPDVTMPGDSGLDLTVMQLQTPLDVDELRETIEELSRAGLVSDEGFSLALGPPLVDRRQLARRLGEDLALEAEIIELLKREVPVMIEKVRANALARRQLEMTQAAHVLQGALAIFGVRAADDLCQRLKHATQRHDPEGTLGWLNRLEIVVASMRAELNGSIADANG